MQQRMRFFLFLTFMAFFASLPANAYAAAIAKVIAIQPGVVLERNGQTQNLALKDSLHVHDVVRTNTTGKVQLIFNDDSVVTIGVNSVFSMSDYSNTQRKSFDATLNKGFARFVTGVIVKNNPSAFKVRTPQATAGIRGTTLALEITGQGTVVSTENSSIRQSVVVGSTTIDAGFRAIFGAGSVLLSGPERMTDAQRQHILNKARINLNSSLNSPSEDLKHENLQLPAGSNLDIGGNNLNTMPDMNLDDDLGTDLGNNLNDDLGDDLGNDLGDDFGDDLDNDLGKDLDDDFDDLKDGLDDDDSLNTSLLQENLLQTDLQATVSGEFDFQGQGMPNESKGVFSFEADLKSGAISGASLTTTDIQGANFTVVNGTGQINSHNFTVSGGTATMVTTTPGESVQNWNMTGKETITVESDDIEGTLNITTNQGPYNGEFDGELKPQ